MKLRHLRGAAILAGAVVQCLWTVPAAGQASKPLVKQTYELEPSNSMPRELSDAAAECDLVAHIRVVSRFDARDDPVPTTRYELEIVEVFASKPTVSLTRLIPFAALGGTVVRGSGLFQLDVPGFPLEPGDEYIAFMQWHEGQQAYTLAYGSDGLWRLEDGRVQSRGRSELAARNRDRPLVEIASELRADSVKP